jgi:Icc protein
MKKLLHISDCHIDKNPNIMGVDSQKNLHRIVDKISTIKADALLISGDLSHNGNLQSYQIIQKIIQPIQIPTLIFAGNHDNLHHLNKVFNNERLHAYLLGKWAIIHIDSVQIQQVSGFITPAHLIQLNKTLCQYNRQHCLLALHHPVVPMQSHWDDKLSLENSQALFSLLKKHTHVRAIVFGHAHQAAYFQQYNLDIIACPSTAVQFNQEKRIGFNEYHLGDNGDFTYKTQWL